MDDVPDPTDFPVDSETPGLRRLDAAFSCQICGEVYDAPMMLSCGHSFCSMCVRRSLRDRHECPTCRNPAEEVQLVKNVQLEDLCDSWRSARDTVLKLIEKVDDLQKKVANNNIPRSRPRKKRKMSNEDSAGHSIDCNSVEIINSNDADHVLEVIPSSDAEEVEARIDGNSIVNCPLCSKHVLYKNVNGHMDSDCRSFLAKPKSERTNNQSSWNSILGNGPSKPASKMKGKKQQRENNPDQSGSLERLPKPSYKLLKDKKLREMLSEYQLSTSGSREQLIARHTQFVLLYNANLDRGDHLRKSLSELRKELTKWEDNVDVGKVSVDDTQTYMKSRNAEFKKHIEAVKASLKMGEGSSPVSKSSVVPATSEPSVQSTHAAASDGAPVGNQQNTVRGGAVIVPDSQEDMA